MKVKLLSVILAASAVFTSTSSAVIVALGGVANTTVGLVTLDTDGAGATPRAVVSGRAIFVSVTDALTGVSASMDTLLSSSQSTPAQFDSALATLIGVTSSTDPGIVRSTTFTNGVLSSTGNQEVGAVSNRSYLFLVAESGGFITGIGAYTGANVPAGGGLIFNPAAAGDTLGVGTSVLAAATTDPVQPISGFQLATAVPEPSVALLGALGVLGLIRRRRI
jgi:hypothetical protein